jgi:hypothetical protein
MDDAELGFNAWVLIGNALHTLLRGPQAAPHSLADERLSRLDAILEPVQPPQMLSVLSSLSSNDRRVLIDACNRAFAVAGKESLTVLGVSEENAAPVLAFLARE